MRALLTVSAFLILLLMFMPCAWAKADAPAHLGVGIMNDTPDFQLDIHIDGKELQTIYPRDSKRLAVESDVATGEHELKVKAYVHNKYLGRRQIGKDVTLKFKMTGAEKRSPAGTVGWYYAFTYRDFLPHLASFAAQENRGSDLKTVQPYEKSAPPQRTEKKRGTGEIREFILRASGKYCVPEGLLTAVIEVESAFNPSAVSHKGAMGLMQLMPETCTRFSVRRPFHPEDNIEGGAKYLSYLLHQWALQFPSHRRLEFSLAAYHAGEGRVQSYGGIPPFAETQDYIRQVLRRYQS